MVQGKLIRRHRIPKTKLGDFWHWKDLNVGEDFCFYGIVLHTVDCDQFTREFMLSQGLIMKEAERMPEDPYTQGRKHEASWHAVPRTSPSDDKLRRFLEYDGKILKFQAAWDDRDSEYGEIRKCELLYFLADDTVSVREIFGKNCGRDPFPQLLRKCKLPKVWTNRPVDYPSATHEVSDVDVTEYYQPKDFLVGETVYVFGRKMIICDCDDFTRNYYRRVFCLEQRPRMDLTGEKISTPPRPRPTPPHDGIGSLEDSYQNTISFLPKPPRRDVTKQLLNANKCLRYEMKMDDVHPEDSVRRFILQYSLADGTCIIYEPRLRNSGILGGTFLRRSPIAKPGSDPLNPEYYTPADFYIGATITAHGQRFVVVGADLYVYRYMQANPEKFPCAVVENLRNYMFNRGLLEEDLAEQLEKNTEEDKFVRIDSVDEAIALNKSDVDRCMGKLKVGGDEEYEKRTKERVLKEYEESLGRRFVYPEHGIAPVKKECLYPVRVAKEKKFEGPLQDCCDKPDCPGEYLFLALL